MAVELPADAMESARISEEAESLKISGALLPVERLSFGRAAKLAGLSLQTLRWILSCSRVAFYEGGEMHHEDARRLSAYSALGHA